MFRPSQKISISWHCPFKVLRRCIVKCYWLRLFTKFGSSGRKNWSRGVPLQENRGQQRSLEVTRRLTVFKKGQKRSTTKKGQKRSTRTTGINNTFHFLKNVNRFQQIYWNIFRKIYLRFCFVLFGFVKKLREAWPRGLCFGCLVWFRMVKLVMETHWVKFLSK
jgi:hypothetical protein